MKSITERLDEKLDNHIDKAIGKVLKLKRKVLNQGPNKLSSHEELERHCRKAMRNASKEQLLHFLIFVGYIDKA